MDGRSNERRSTPATSMHSMPRKGLALIALFAISPILGACGSQTLSAGTECRVFGPITYSSRDTVETQRGVRVHNAKGQAACGWRR